MNCPECLENYSQDNRIPIILIYCGHTFCEVFKKIK